MMRQYYDEPQSPWRSVIKYSVISIAGLAILIALTAWLYWRSFYGSPQYSMASIVAAAKNNDQDTVNSLLDTDAIVDNMLPQILASAGKIYGRGMPPQLLNRLTMIAEPLMPAIKYRARERLIPIVQKRLGEIGDEPFPLLVIGADRFLDIKIDGDNAIAMQKYIDKPVRFKLKRAGEVWKVVGIEDDQFADDLAKQIGQSIVAAALSNDVSAVKGLVNKESIDEMIKQAEDLLP